jgi:hypothetical protein
MTTYENPQLLLSLKPVIIRLVVREEIAPIKWGLKHLANQLMDPWKGIRTMPLILIQNDCYLILR